MAVPLASAEREAVVRFIVPSAEDRMSGQASPGVTPLMVFYGAFAAAGAVVPWYFNIRYMVETGEFITPHGLIAGGFVTSLASSLTSDFLIGTTPVLVWMVVEARRLGMRHRWAYVAGTFLIRVVSR